MRKMIAIFLVLVGCGNVSKFGEPSALEGLSVSRGVLIPAFSTDVLDYTLNLPLAAEEVSITPSTAPSSAASIDVAGSPTASGQESIAIELGLGANPIDILVADGADTSTYSIAVQRGGAISQNAYGKASNTDAEDQFGWEMALDGDTLVVSARFEDSAAQGVNGSQADNLAAASGAAYIFFRSPQGSWSQQAYLKASNGDVSDGFGSSVAVGGDTVVVGASQEDSSATGVNGNGSDNGSGASGAVYVFTRTGGSWSQQAYLKPSNTGPGQFFGSSVALAGDSLVVGAVGESSLSTGINGSQADAGATSAGAAYVFNRTGGVWSQEAYIKASNTAAGDQFGSSITMFGDTVAVAARMEGSGATGINGDQSDDSVTAAGAVYVFTRNAGSWSQQAYIKASEVVVNNRFGTSLALGADTLAVGAIGQQSFTGAVYVFERTSSVWSEQAVLEASNADVEDTFGSSLDLGRNVLVVGAPDEDSDASGVDGDQGNNGQRHGAAYLFSRTGTTWTQHAYLKASSSDAFDAFGFGVAYDRGTIAVSAFVEDSAATGVGGDDTNNDSVGSGAIYLFGD